MILNKDIEKILDVISNMSKENDYYKLLEEILETGMKISNSDGGTLYLKNEDKLEFFFMITKSQNIRKGGKDEKIDLPPLDINSQSVAALCGKTKKIINVEDVYSDKRYNWEGPKKYDKLTGYHTESVLVLPLFDKDKNVLGVMQLINASQFKKVVPFSFDVERIIYSLSSLSGMLLDNIKLYDDIKELLDSFVKSMVKAIESRTPYNAFHTVNVAKICNDFVDYINNNNYDSISEDDKNELIMAAYLHDVGKIIVPSSILNKATRFERLLDKMLLRYDLIKANIEISYLKNELSKEEYNNEIKLIDETKEFIINLDKKSFLTDDDKKFIESIKDKEYNTSSGVLKLLTDKEYENAKIERGTLTHDERCEIEKHVVYTHNILNELKFGRKYKMVKDIASSHHEYLDGSGYPNHIKEDSISKYVRIITISDIYESLVSTDRPYKKPMSNEKALSILNEMKEEGKLDKNLVEIFTKFKSE